MLLFHRARKRLSASVRPVGRRSKVFVWLVSLVLAGTVAGVAYASVNPGISSTTTDVIKTRASNVNLGSTGGEPGKKLVLSVSLPAGSWVLHADASISSPAYADYFHCGIYNGTTQVTEDEMHLTAGDAGALSITTAIISNTGFTASFLCWHDTTQAAAAADVEHDSSFWAHKATSLAKGVTP
jgi:hypothetical protein